MRDAVFNKLYDLARYDTDIVLVVADMGAPSLDKFRADLCEYDQFIDVGVSEQNMVAVAAGLTLMGRNVFTYAIAPFATSRCYEALKVNFAYTGLPLTVIGIGANDTYWEGGPTHHAFDAIALMQLLGATIYQPANDEQAAQAVEMAYKSKALNYISIPRGTAGATVKKWDKRVLAKP